MKDLKYLASFIIPVLVFLGLSLGGVYTYMGVGFAFVLIPLLEPVFPSSRENLDENERDAKLSNRFFDWLLYLNVPIVYAAVFLLANWIYTGGYETYELTGNLLSVGTLLGANGINVAHELGHRFNRFENVLAQALLLPSFYMHFFIEHNLGHHKYVATPEDPATARFRENVYLFWVRSAATSYTHAWKLEANRLERAKQKFWSSSNKMIWFTLFQVSYLAAVALVFSPWVALFTILVGVIGFLLLETINYIEHYGLLRNKLKNDRYERVRPKHSWNSNHELGRIVLYELTRHSDHHFISNKKYQVLDHHEDSPQLPFGYPTSMLMALVPPVWFGVMDKKVEQLNKAKLSVVKS